MLPNFVGLGVQRGGTTWVYQCLREHPQVFVPPAKELHFFDTHFDRGVAWYESQFTPEPQHQAVGEITPNYFTSELAVQRIVETIPDARFFIVLREPVSRAFSAYQLFRDRYHDWSFREACERGDDLMQHGQYASAFERLYRHIPRENVLVLLYDQLQNDPGGLLRELFTFLKVDPEFQPTSMQRRVNRVVYPTLQNALQRAHLGWSIDMIRNTALGEWIKRRHAKQPAATREKLSDADREHIKAMCCADILATQKLTGLDLSHWL